MSKRLGMTWGALCLSVAGRVWAAGVERLPSTGWVDLYSGTGGEAKLSMPFGKYPMPDGRNDFYGVMGDFSLQLGSGSMAGGIRTGFAGFFMNAAHDFNSVVGSSIDLFFRGRYCIEGEWRLCFGGQFTVSVNPYKFDEGSEEEFSSYLMNLLHLGREMRNLPEAAALEPVAAFRLERGDVFVQAALGLSLGILYGGHYDRMPYMETYDDVEASLVWSLDGGLVLADILGIQAGLRGLSSVSFDDDETYLGLDLGLRLLLSPVSPWLTFTVPLTGDQYSDFVNLALVAGARFEF